jgi:hypothetical protein
MILGLLLACDDGDDAGDADVPIDAAGSLDAASADAGGADADVALDAGGTPLTVGTDFPTGGGDLCGLGVDDDDSVWVQPCSGASILGFDPEGEPLDPVGSAGEAANDVDLSFAPVGFELDGQAVAAGEMLVVNGETGVAEIHAREQAEASPLVTAFGASHVVGGAFHRDRGSFFLVQDKQSATDPNTVAEIDAATGAVLNKFSTLPGFDVNYGDLEICRWTGNLFLVSSTEAALAELTPAGALVGKYPLPPGVTLLSGLGLTENGEAWVASTSGQVWRLDGVPCHD